MKNVIITGATGMVGKAVLLECLEDERITNILLIGRKPIEIAHAKIQELLLPDLKELASTKTDLSSYDACFYCMGVSSAGMKEENFHDLTFNIMKVFVDHLYAQNPEMVFNYVSGQGTDSSEAGKVMWARVKGKTENYMLNKGFKDSYAFRPNMIIPEKGIKSNTRLYNIAYIITRPLFSLFKKMKSVTTTTKFGKAMINTLFFPQELKHLENPEINKISVR